MLPEAFFRPAVAVVALLAATSAAAVEATAREAFLAQFRESVASKDTKRLMELVCWDGADDESRSSFERTFRVMTEQHLVGSQVGEVPPATVFSFQLGGRSFGPNLEPAAVLNLTIAFGSPDGPRFQYQYPLGVKGEALLISPMVRRAF